MARTNRGVTFIEVLVSVAILAMSLLAMMSLWAFNYNLTQDHGTQNYGLNLARRVVEDSKLGGFYALPEGEFTIYADAEGGIQGGAAQADSQFRVVVTVASDRLFLDQEGNVIGPADNAIRQLTVSVFDLQEVTGTTPRLVARTGTFFARSGV
jgi:prepilin-type N-terminal cleavage/methylation domain-containing protein